MISVVEQILGISFGETSYDDIIASGALILGITAILVIIQVFKSILRSDFMATYTKGSNTKLSEHFTSSEFDCKGAGCCKETIINPQLVEYL